MNKYIIILKNNIYAIPFSMALAIVINIIIKMTGLTEVDEAFVRASNTLEAYGEIGKIFLIFIFAPIVEELIYRKLIFKLARRYLNFILAAIISAFLFGITHMNLTQFIYAFIMGFFLCFGYEKTGYFITPIFMHMASNIAVAYFMDGDERFLLFLCLSVAVLCFYRWVK